VNTRDVVDERISRRNSKGYDISVCKGIRTRYQWYPETPIIIHALIEQNGLCREE